MSRKLLDAEKRWQRYQEFCEQNVIEILSRDLPEGIVSFILLIQEHFDEIRQVQDEEKVGGGSLYEYEAWLIMAVAELSEECDYLVVRTLLEEILSTVFAPDRISQVEAGDPVFTDKHKKQIRKAVKHLKKL